MCASAWEFDTLKKDYKNFRENESNLNSQNKSFGNSSECSFDLPIVDKDFFYDDWRKIFIQVAKWRESAMQNGW